MLFRSELFVNEKCEKKKNCETQILGKTEKLSRNGVFNNKFKWQSFYWGRGGGLVVTPPAVTIRVRIPLNSTW